MALFGYKRQRILQKPQASDTNHACRKRPAASTIVFALMLIAGVGIMASPALSDWWNSLHQTRAIAAYMQAVEQSDPEMVAQILDDARAYNARLADTGSMRTLSDAELAEYNGLLDVDGTGVMGYVQMSSLGINCPIYHGVDETVLQVAVGHLEGTSLPVGGASTHAVIAGHRGLPRARLFSDLDKAKKGDIFTIAVLGETLTYEVDQIRVVLPEDLSELDIVRGTDLVTLVTCTPYGINTHRLLVRGHRVDNASDSRVISADAVQIPNYLVVLAVGMPLLFVYLAARLCTAGSRNDKEVRGAGHAQD